ncbi:hypothetical protein E4T42_04100 [Aureobasidium subglaciale]|nr:hypothetical protein E4T42_04100 [Aureobasidium subglaciale]
MASATAPEVITAIYHHPINGSSEPTPAKPPSQEAQYITQVLRSPAVSQHSAFIIASQKDAESLIQDSLERQPETPARQSSAPPHLYEQTAPRDNDCIVQDSYEEKLDASSPSVEHQFVTHNTTLALPLAGHPPSQDHGPGEESVGLARPEQPSEQTTTVLQQSAGTQPPISTQTAAKTRELNKASPSKHTAPDDEEDIQDCITVRAPPITPSARVINGTTIATSAVLQSAAHSARDISSLTPLNRSRSSLPNVSAITALTTPSMPPKISSTKASASVSQGRKGTSTTSKKPSKTVPPSVDIVNRGETSAIASLQILRAGGTSQVNITRQTAEATTKTLTKAETSGKAPARPSKAPATKLTTRSSQQGQSQPRSSANKQMSRRIEDSDGFDEYAVPQSPKAAAEIVAPKLRVQEKAKSQRKAKSNVPSAPSVKKASRSQPKRQAVKSADTDDEDDDEVYSAPKVSKLPTAHATRASTRAQTQKVTRDDILDVANRGDVASATTRGTGLKSAATKSTATKKENPAPRRPAPRKKAEETASEAACSRESEGSPMDTIHISKRPRADISSTTEPVAIKAKNEQKTPHERPHSNPSYIRAHEPGTTPRHPISLNDDDDDSDGEGVTGELLDTSYNDIVNETMSQEAKQKQDTSLPTEPSFASSSGEARGSPIRQHPSPTSTQHPSPLVEEHANRKPNIVGFTHAGPKNQGTANKRDSRPDPVLSVEADTSSPNLDQFSVQASTVPGSHKRLTVAYEARVTELPVQDHTVLSVDVSAAPEETIAIIPEPTVDRSRKAVASLETSPVEKKGLTAFETLAKPAISGHARRKPTRDLAHSHEREHVETTVRSRLPKSMARDSSHRATTELEDRVQKPKTTLGASIALLQEESSNQIARDAKSPVADNPVQSLSKHRELNPATQLYVVPSSDAPNFNDYDEPEQVLSEPARPLSIQDPPRRESSRASVPLVQKEQTRTKNTQSQLHQPALPVPNPKRPAPEMTKGPTTILRTLRTSTRESEPQFDISAAAVAARPVMRRVSQVANNGSPIAHGEYLPQSTERIEHKRNKMAPTTSIPPLRLTQQNVVDPFDEVLALKPRQKVRHESPLEKIQDVDQSPPEQNSQAITHIGFDGDTRANAKCIPILEPFQKPTMAARSKGQVNPPQRALTSHTSLGLMDALRSEVAPKSGQRGRNEDDDGKELCQADEPRDEDDPDKTLVNRDSDDGDDDDDDSQSRDSSDISGDESKSALSMWRRELESHQGDVYEQLVRMAHRLTNHLKDHETAIKDIGADYTQDGRRLVKRFEKDNEEQIEEYCQKMAKIEGAFVLGCKQVYGSLQKDVKEVMASSERYVKALHKQVDAGGRLDQIMRTYHP